MLSPGFTPDTLLDFWFDKARQDAAAIPKRMAFWFKPGGGQDRAVHDRFGDVLEAASRDHLTDWLATTHGRLALILTFDQAPRVIHRQRPQAFAFDGRALALALAGLDAGIDRKLGLAERAFFCMPLQHSEDRLVQKRSIKCYEALAADFQQHAGIAEGFLKHAREHAEIIERFGRYPHRNKALGRKSTEAELAFLEHGPRYGQ